MADNGYTKTISTAEFSDTPRLILEQATGDVRIEAWDNPSIEISVTDDDEAFDVAVDGSQVRVQGLPPQARNRGDRPDWNWSQVAPDLTGLGIDIDKVSSRVQRNAARIQRNVERSVRRSARGRGFDIDINLGRWTSGLDYRIKVPYNCHVSLRTSSGDITIKGVHGTHLVQTTSGDIRMQDVGGALLITSASGDFTGDKIEGRLGVKTASGGIEVRRASLQEVSLHSASGDVELELRQVPEREFDAKSVSGDVMISLPGDARLTADISTLSGDIDCELPHTKERSGRARVLTINGGGNLARFSTVSGDITIERGRSSGSGNSENGEGGEDITRPESAGPTPRQQAELELLQAVERGELSPQEAMTRLGQLGRDR